MTLPIDFSIHGSEKPFSNSPKSTMPFLPSNFSRFLSSVSEQKLPRFLGNISNPLFWRHFPPYLQYDQKLPFNPAIIDQISGKSSRTRFNHLPMSPSRLFSPSHSFMDKKSSASMNSMSAFFDSWNHSSPTATATTNSEKNGLSTNSTLMINLQSGVKKRLEEITESDLWHCTKQNDEFTPNWSEVVQISQISEDKKIEITFQTNNKQIVYQTDLHRPFFVKNVGWCSLFPGLTQKMYGIQSSLMDIGQTCLTLSRKRKSSNNIHDTNGHKRSKDTPRLHLSMHSNKL